jgi:hypothetical protein
MRKIYFLIFALAACIRVSVAQTTYTWVGGATGDYQVAANWSPTRTTPAVNDILSFNATSAINVVNVPNQTIGAIAIASGTSAVSFATNVLGNALTLNAATPLIFTTNGKILAADFLSLTIGAAASFTLSSGTLGIAPGTGGKIVINGSLTLAGGTLDLDVAGTGGTTINGTINYVSGSFVTSAAGAISWANGSNYNHAVDGSSASTIPLCTWGTGSTCTINGMTAGTVTPANINKNIFYNLRWNCTGQSADVVLIPAGDSVTVKGAFSVLSTNASKLIIAGAAGGLLKADGYVQSGGYVALQSSSGTTTVRVVTSFSQTGGTLDAVIGSGSGTAFLDVQGAVTVTAPAIWQNSSTSNLAQLNLQFGGSVTQNVAFSGTWNAPAAGRSNITINNSDLVAGVSLTGVLHVYNTNSTGAATCTMNGTLTVTDGSSYIHYSGAGAGGTTLIYSWIYPQIATSNEFPAANGPQSLTINNALGVTFPAGFNRTLSGTLSLLDGNLDMPGSTLQLSNTSLGNQLVHTGGYIFRGTLGRYFPTTGLPTTGTTVNSRFPFGTGTVDRSLNVFFSGANLTGGTAGYIYASHNAAVNATAISITDDIALDKRSNSSWTISVGSFALGSGGHTISVTALGTNIGSVTNINTLRLTDAVGVYGTVIPTTGTISAPVVGKSGLLVADISTKTLYFGSNNLNALQIIIYTWLGNVSTSWTNPANWSSSVGGYPSSTTEVADISSTLNYQPQIPTATSISLYQLIVGAPITLTLTGTASLNVAETVTFNGSAAFASTSTFTYSGITGVTQNIASLTYGNLVFTGTGTKILPATVTVTGNYTNLGVAPTITGNTFVFAGTGSQKISEGFYNNITISGNRGGGQIGLGNLSSNNTIDIAGTFSVTATNYTVKYDYNTVNFSSIAANQMVPGFIYGSVTFSGNINKVFDPLGSTDPNHVIQTRSMVTSGFTFTTTGSKVRYYRDATTTFQGNSNLNYNDLEITGDLKGGTFQFKGATNVMGVFAFTCVNFTQIPYYTPADAGSINFVGSGDQTIPACVTGFTYDNITYARGSRNITLDPSGEIRIYGAITAKSTPSSWTAGNGFIVTNSTVNFVNGSDQVPALQPAGASTNNYHHLKITGGTRQMVSNTSLGGNLTVTGTDASPGTFKVGNGSSTRTLTINGNLTISGTSAVAAATAQVEMSNGSAPYTRIYLYGNLSISGTGQMLTTASSRNGLLYFYGTTPQYTNTSTIRNTNINYFVGDNVSATTLTLNNTLYLNRAATMPDSVTVYNNATINFGNSNLNIGSGSTGTAYFALNSGATLITANTGGVEGVATSNANGTIFNDNAILLTTYSSGASYVFNGATTTPFPSSEINTMANLTLGANVSLNKNITVTNTLYLGSNTLTQANRNITFSGLNSTTGNIYADKNSTITISGTLGTVGPLRFATGGNITGQLNINRAVSVPLNSDLTIDITPQTGNLIITSGAELDINGNTLTVNGAVSGAGTIGGSNTSNLTLGGTAGTLNFTTGKRILKNLTLSGSATATLGTALDITAGTSPGNAGTVSVTGTSVLTTGGNLTLKSNMHGTARVGSGSTSGGYISGAVTVERYIESSAKRAWRLLAAPAYGQTIKQAWQENQAAGVDPGTGFGTIITSNSATWAADGFDYQTPGNSLLVYNPVTNVWDGVTNTNIPINSAGGNKAYMVFIRGDRSATPYNGPASTSAILRNRGTLYQGNLPAVNVPNAGQFAAIGNNYASAIDFTDIRDANIDQTFTVWDPKLVGSSGLGGYVTFSASTSPAWKPVPAGGSYVANVPNTRIESGQGFVVYSTPGNGNITLKESSKVSGSNMVFRPVAGSTAGIKQSLTTNLYSNIGGNTIITDGNTVVFSDGFSNDIDSRDAIKVTNTAENFGLLRNDKTLIVEARQLVTTTDTVFFVIRKMKAQPYKMELIAENFDGAVSAWLEDKFLKTTTALNMSGTTTYDFVLTADQAGSYAPDRFRVVFTAARPLPVNITTVKATQQGKNIAVEWKVENELNVKNYDIEKSADGRNFSKAGQIAARGGSSAYTWTDVNASAGDNFYRIRSNDNDGKSAYSQTVKVTIAGKTGSFTIFPNPVKDGMIGLQMKDVVAGQYNIRLVNQLGQVVDKRILNHSGGNATQSVQLPQNPGDGVYQLEIISPDNKTTVLKMLVLGN